MERLQRIETWLSGLWPGTPFTLAPASADASFRRYFRVNFHDAGNDTPHHENAPPPSPPSRGVLVSSLRSDITGNCRGDSLPFAPEAARAAFPCPTGISFGHDGAAEKLLSRREDKSFIVMDAPPSHEDVGPWLKVQQLFQGAGVHVPDVLATDLDQGFLLLSDLGNTTYLAALTPERVADIPGDYLDAIDALIKIQAASRPGCLPDYDRALLQRELDLFPDWYIGRHLNLPLDDAQRQALTQVFEQILAVNLDEPRVFVHRDYHSRNLMLLEGATNPGIIDFQDAVYGPISYDLVSLLKDAYVDWDEEVALDWLVRYWERARKAGLPVRPDFAEFHRDYEWMGVQRHLKVLGIFARLCHRDGKDGYLKDMPLVAKYLRRAVQRYDELTPLRRLLDHLEDKITVLGHTMEKKALGVRSGE